MPTIRFRSSYDYSASRLGIEVPITLAAKGREVRLLAKVDTGASFCIFARAYAEQLGVEVESGSPVRVGTVTGAFDAYGHPITMSCLGWELETTVYFAGAEEFNRNVVGRDGWLSHFRLGLIDADARLLLSHYDDE